MKGSTQIWRPNLWKMKSAQWYVCVCVCVAVDVLLSFCLGRMILCDQDRERGEENWMVKSRHIDVRV